MSKYIQFNDIQDRYPRAANKGGDEEIESFVTAAEVELEGMFAGRFTLPFSSNNETIKTLAIDLAYIKMGVASAKDNEVRLKNLMNTVKMIQGGKMQMITTSGEIIDRTSVMWSSTQDYHPRHGIIDVTDQLDDPDRIQDEIDERNL